MRNVSMISVAVAAVVTVLFATAVGCGDATPHPSDAKDTPESPGTPLPESDEPADLGFVPGQIIVKFKEPKPFAELQDSGLDVGGEHLAAARDVLFGAIRFDLTAAEGETVTSLRARTSAIIDALSSRPDVEYAHGNYIMAFSLTPGDPHYAAQWNYTAINLPAAWDITTGSPDVTIAVLDTGRLDHPDLIGKWLPGGYDYGDLDANPQDDGSWRHGTHVAGILGASANNGIGSAGVCWGCPLLSVKVSSSSDQATTVNYDQLPAAIQFASLQGARVINMSFGHLNMSGANNCPQALQSAINEAFAQGTVLVAASGNEYETASKLFKNRIHFPAMCDNVIAVAASNETGSIASYSNRNSRVDIIAPGGALNDPGGHYGRGVECANVGVDGALEDPTYTGTNGVLSTWAINAAPMDYCYRYLSGTSMAAPHVAGVAALMLSVDPSLTPAKVVEILKQTAKPMFSCVGCAAGLLNAHEALKAASGEIFGDGFE